jgi:8-oxo-dGTP diphosphatase
LTKNEDIDQQNQDDRTMPVEVAICILYPAEGAIADRRFLMQLRDNKPNILYPGYWGLFGGHIEPGETPEIAVVREIAEEIGYDLPSVTKFGIYTDETAIRHVFQAPLTVALAALSLNEGWDMGLLTLAEIAQGDRYSEAAGENRPIGPIHQKILQEFARLKPEH